jgi:endoribonuclease Dicer
MVGYLQSRGRARKQASTFIVMIPKGDAMQLERYQALQQKEPEVARVYQTRHADTQEEDADDDMDETDPVDFAARERYVVPSTGAVLSYDNSLSLLNHLCSLIPRDAFTLVHKPKYTGEFEQTIHLPRALPLSPQDLTFTGPLRRSKQEAKRAAAFMAVKRLREMDVFDEYLLPLAKYSGGEEEEVRSITGKPKREIPPNVMSVRVRDPWYIGQTLWSHAILVENTAVASLITGTVLPPQDLIIGGSKVKTLPAALLEFDEDHEHEQRLAMHQFTRCGVWYNNTSRPFSSPFSFYLVPITPDRLPDFEAIQRLLVYPKGNSDWSEISEEDYDKLMVICRAQFGSIHILRRIREDLTPLSTPLPGSREAISSTYHEYWTKKWSKKNRVVLPTNGPILETFRFQRSNIGTFLVDSSPSYSSPTHIVRDGRLLPQAGCAWLPISHSVRRAFEVLPVLCHRITAEYRARCARYELNLPPSISTNFIIEAFTIPAASFPFSNQRMETLGDAVLQLCTTVHLLNRYPNRHEGQLTTLRQQVVGNRYLMHRALDLGLEQFVNSEITNVSKWRYTSPDDALPYHHGTARLSRVVTREFPRRSLQDCMEALLGASFLAGGIPVALQAGTALGLELGGPLPWFIRYHSILEPTIIAPAFAALEESLNYKFQRNHLVMESLTHPSLTFSDVPSYQRLEFLGDGKLFIPLSMFKC